MLPSDIIEEYFCDYQFEFDENSHLSEEAQLYEYIVHNADSPEILKLIENLELNKISLFGKPDYGFPTIVGFDKGIDAMSPSKFNKYKWENDPFGHLDGITSQDTYSVVLSLTTEFVPYADFLDIDGVLDSGVIDSVLTVIDVAGDVDDIASKGESDVNIESGFLNLEGDQIAIGEYHLLSVENTAEKWGNQYTYETVFFVGNAYPFNSLDDSGPAIPVIFAYTNTTYTTQTIVSGSGAVVHPPAILNMEDDLFIDIVGWDEDKQDD